jgi:hypothetical protein
MTVADNIIALNQGETGAGVSLGIAGLQIERGQLSTVGLYWNESLLAWQINNADGISSNIAYFPSGTTSYITKVEEDLDPHLGANLVSNGFSITSLPSTNLILAPSNSVQIDTPVVFSSNISPPSVTTDYATLYGGPVNDGETGLYVTNEKSNNQELVTKRKAIIYSLIF